jgi:hypothetical protein
VRGDRIYTSTRQTPLSKLLIPEFERDLAVRLARVATSFITVLLASATVHAQSGLRLPERGEPGLDPGFARGWFAPDYDRFGFATYQWRDPLGFAPSQRLQWSYAFGGRASFSMSYANGRDSDLEARPLSLYGRYWLSSDWALSAQSLSRDPGGLFRLQDLRIGVQRRF